MQSPLIFDSHSHYNDPRFFGDEMNDLKMSRDELIAYLLKNGVGKILCAGTDIATSRECIELAERFDGVYAAAGIHPHDTELVKNKAECIKELISLLRHKKVVAIGEIGLDFHYDFSDRLIQMEWLDLQLRLAKECNMPVIIHDREAHGAPKAPQCLSSADITSLFRARSRSKTHRAWCLRQKRCRLTNF